MIQIASKLKYKLFSSDASIPPAEKVTPVFYTIAGIAFLFGITTTLLNLFWKTNPPTQKKPIATVERENEKGNTDLYSIINRNLFNIKGLIPDAEEDGSKACSLEPFKSNLPYKISGILFGGTSETSLVVFDSGTNPVFKQGDSLPQGGVLYSIEKNRILVTNKNCPEFIELTSPPPPDARSRSPQNASGANYKEDGFERNGNATTASKQWVNNILTNDFAKTLEEAKASPNLVGGQVKGFVITNITQNSVYAKLGLKDGDIVSAINGIELNDAARAIQTLNSMRNENTIDLQIMRGGQPISFKVNVQ
ncbi:PDZ domain-containing protein [Silvanigrella paludirubra]|uniref:PDZ domain-containing protein n=1 Tax=Silvanigrella paludirubra TaxID=2499159 RepID=A0A6N6VTJ1_9BACT|nr:PDZ domain-containing protein [Silvanigrella paludirubra]KAB8039493.1 PDZ domain-containing protein [Silvanigrella paludirubra]